MPRPGRVGPIEAFEGPSGGLRRHAGAVVADGQHSSVAVTAGRHPNRRARGRVHQRVGEQVGRHLMQACLVARHLKRPGQGGVDRAVRVHRPCVCGGVGGQLAQIDGRHVERTILIGAGERQQVLDQGPHANRLRLGAGHRIVQGARRFQAPRPIQLGVSPDRRYRRAQLVGGVGHKGPQAGLAADPLLERRLDVAEHRVERGRQLAGLGSLVGFGHALGQVPGGDRRCHPGHRLHRTDPQVDDPPAKGAERREDHQGPGRLDLDEVGDGGIDRVERHRQGDHGVRPVVGVAEHPVIGGGSRAHNGERLTRVGCSRRRACVDGGRGCLLTPQPGGEHCLHPVVADNADIERAEGSGWPPGRIGGVAGWAAGSAPVAPGGTEVAEVPDRSDRLGQLAIHLAEQVVLGDPGDRHRDDAQHDGDQGDARHHPGAERHRALSRSARCSPPRGSCG